MSIGADMLKLARATLKRKHRTPLQLARAQGKVDRVDSSIEALFAQHLKAAKVAPWERNYRPFQDVGYEIDFAWPEITFGIEVQGGVHCIKANFHRDIRKAARLKLDGWELLAVDSPTIRSGEALVWTLRLLRRRAEFLGRPA